MSHTRLLTLCILFLLCLPLSACGSQQGSSSVTALRVWYSTDDPAERAWSQQLAGRFNATHPAIHVQLTDYSFEDLNTKLQLALSSGNPPDVGYVTPRGPGIPAYVTAHQLRDLTAAARGHGWAARLQPGLLTAYNRPFTFLGLHPDHVVAVPTSLAAVGVLYNRRLLQKLHLSVPSSLPAFETALVRAKRAGYTPIGLGNADGWLGDDWYLTLVNALTSPAALQPEQRLSPRFSFQQQPFQEAARTLQRWSQRGYFAHDFGGMDAQEGIDLFFRGKTLFSLVSSSQNPQITQDQRLTGISLGFFAFPRQGGGAVMPDSGYLGWVVPAAAQHPEQAIAFIDSLLTPANARFLLSKGVLPAARAPGLRAQAGWQQSYLAALQAAVPGVYLDAAPIANLNATMEANVQLLLQGYEQPRFLVHSLQEVYTSHGNRGSAARIDGEF